MNDRKNSAVQRPYGRSHGALLAHVPEEENGTDDGDSVTSETDISDAGEDGSDDNSATPDAVMASVRSRVDRFWFYLDKNSSSLD